MKLPARSHWRGLAAQWCRHMSVILPIKFIMTEAKFSVLVTQPLNFTRLSSLISTWWNNGTELSDIMRPMVQHSASVPKLSNSSQLSANTNSTQIPSRQRYQLNTDTKWTQIPCQHRYHVNTNIRSIVPKLSNSSQLSADTKSTQLPSQHRYQLNTNYMSTQMPTQHRCKVNTDTKSTQISSQHRYQVNTDIKSIVPKLSNSSQLSANTNSTQIQTQ